MFERFTDQARRVVVLAQEQARMLHHHYIGTEHLLLGLLAVRDGLAERALSQFGITQASAEQEIIKLVGRGKSEFEGHVPFTPRGKKVMEFSLRESLTLQHEYIGPEHLLLAIIREGNGVAIQVIRSQAGDPAAVRAALLDLLPTSRGAPARRWQRPGSPISVSDPRERHEFAATPAADASLNQAARIAGSRPVGSHHLLLAALDDPNSAVTRALAGLGVDLDRTRGALRDVDITGTSDEPPDEAGRRQMSIQVSEDQLTIRATDPALLSLARSALEALGDQREQPDTIPGDAPASASLSSVWQAIHDSLEDIRRRAAARGGTAPGKTAPSKTAPGEGAPGEGGAAGPDEPGAAGGSAG